MALPPERITVKRRRDDDPVEALCMSVSGEVVCDTHYW